MNARSNAEFRRITAVMASILMAAAVWADDPTEWFVKPDGDDEAAGTSWATALASPQVALDRAIAGDTITVTNGVYIIDRRGYTSATFFRALDIDRAIHLRSVNGPAVTTLDRGLNGTSNHRTQILRIRDDEAIVEGFTIRDGWTWQSDPGGVDISAGVLRNCIIRDNYVNVGTAASGLHLSGSGLVDACIVMNNTHGSTGNFVTMEGGTMRNTLITGHAAAAGAASVVTQSGGVMEHCTIAGNVTGPGLRPALRLSGGEVINSIIYHNRRGALPGSFPGTDLNVYRTGGTITYSCFSPLIAGTGNTDRDPGFVDPDGGDFRLAQDSAGIDAGMTLAWMTPGSLDLAGVPRIIRAPDMGAYETQPLRGMVIKFR